MSGNSRVNLIFFSLFSISICLAPGYAVGAQSQVKSSPVSISKGSLIWSDDFAGVAGSQPDPESWSSNIGNYRKDMLTTRSPDLATLDGSDTGSLNIVTKKINDPSLYHGICANGKYCQFASGWVSTRNLVLFKYGYIEARIKQPTGLGNTTAFWMLRDGNYNPPSEAAGEIDISEWYGNKTKSSWSTLHFPPTQGLKSINSIGTSGKSNSSLDGDFHTYGIAWLPDSITFLLDGAVLKTYTALQISTWPFNNFFYLILYGGVGWPQPNTIMGGTWDGWQTSTMSIDSIKVWELNGYGEVIQKSIPNMTPQQMLDQLK